MIQIIRNSISSLQRMIPSLPAIGIISIIGVSACQDVPTSRRFLSPEETLHSLEVNYPAVNLALVSPYDTVTLSAVAKNALGDTLADTVTTILSTTSAQVVIYPNGVIRGVAQTSASGVPVTISATYKGVTQTATVQVVVTNVANPPKLKSFSVGIEPTDTFQVGKYSGPLGTPMPTLTPVILDSIDRPVPRAVVAYRPLDPSVLGAIGVRWIPSTSGFYHFSLNGGIGVTTVYAKAMIYGVPVFDSFTIRVHEPWEAAFHITDTVRILPSVVIYRGGLVVWVNDYTLDSLDVVFTNPEKAKVPSGTSFWTYYLLPSTEEGNIAPFKADSTVSGNTSMLHQSKFRGRSFPEPGIYTWHSTRYPAATGVIEVR